MLACLLAVAVATWYAEPAPVPGVTVAGPVAVYGASFARAVLLVAITATLGLALLPQLLGRARSAEHLHVLRTARRATLVATIAWPAAALAALVLQAAVLTAGDPVDLAVLASYLADFGVAQAMVVSAAVGALSALLTGLAIRRAGRPGRATRAAPGTGVGTRLLALAAGLGLLPLVATGHAGEASARWHDLTMIALELHVFAATAWVGGLAAVAALLVRRPPLLATALPRFSQLAGLCLATVATSGAVSALVELATTPGIRFLDAATSTPYGQLVLGKTLCLLALALLGARIRFRLLPGIRLGRPTALAGWLIVELAVMGVAFGLGVALSRAAVVLG